MSATEPVVMTLREAKEGADRSSAFFNGEALTAISRNGSTMKLARRLVAAGAPDMPVEVPGGRRAIAVYVAVAACPGPVDDHGIQTRIERTALATASRRRKHQR